MAQSYEKAGVNLEAGYEVVRRIKKHVASTSRLGVMGNIGAFGGMFDLSALNVKEPVLVSGTDGVGTKLKLAFEMDKHDTIGVDAVAMCVNDVLAQGAEPLVFLDYVAVGHNEPQKIEAIVSGVADGCRQAGCALVGGETAEMPGMYSEGEYDIAGFTVGVVEKSKLIDGSKVRAGDVLVGIASSGVHSNGFSLVRKILADNCLDLHKVYPELSNKLLGEVLLTPTKIYVKQVLEVIRSCDVHGISHITGGGFDENIPRILHEGQGLEIEEGTWEILPVFRFLEKYGKVAHREMFNIFNMGIGMVIALDASQAEKAIAILAEQGEKAAVIGRVTDTEGVVIRYGRATPCGLCQRQRHELRGYRHGLRAGRDPGPGGADGLRQTRRRGCAAGCGARGRGIRIRPERVCLEGRLRARDRAAARPSRRGAGLLGGVHAHRRRRAAGGLRRTDRQHPPFAAAGIPRGACHRTGAGIRRQGLRCDDPLCRCDARRREDHLPAGVRIRRRRHRRAGSPDSCGGISALYRND